MKRKEKCLKLKTFFAFSAEAKFLVLMSKYDCVILFVFMYTQNNIRNNFNANQK